MARATAVKTKTEAVRSARILRMIVMILLAVICVAPFYLMFVNATRTSDQVQSGISFWFGSNLMQNIKNFQKAQNGLGITIFKSMINSFKVSLYDFNTKLPLRSMLPYLLFKSFATTPSSPAATILLLVIELFT